MATLPSMLLFTLRRDRMVVLSALLALTALAWGYVVWLEAQMPDASMASMPGMPMPDMASMDMSAGGMMAPAFVPWSPGRFVFMFLMWVVMMVGMMTPSVAPMVLIYVAVARHGATVGEPFAPAGWFVAGYLLAWTLFALVAVLAQWQLERVALLTPMMMNASRPFGGLVLIAAGIYQWSPLKDHCLAQCRAPLAFVQRHGGFQPGARGSIRLGLLHGAYCVGCCWALMALLFVGGVMNLLWIAALMIFVLLERILPGARYFSRLTGLAAVIAGVWLFAS